MLEYFSMKNRIYIKDLKDHVGKEVIIAGWVDVRRDQGKMAFFDIRDMTGKVQAVALPNHADVIEKLKEVNKILWEFEFKIERLNENLMQKTSHY